MTLERLGGVLRLRVGLGDDHGDAVADIADLALRQQRVGPHLHVGAVLGLHGPAADQVAEPIGGNVRAVEDRQHARHVGDARLVDADQLRVGVRAAHEHRIGLTMLVDVVGVPALAGDETLILLAE